MKDYDWKKGNGKPRPWQQNREEKSHPWQQNREEKPYPWQRDRKESFAQSAPSGKIPPSAPPASSRRSILFGLILVVTICAAGAFIYARNRPSGNTPSLPPLPSVPAPLGDSPRPSAEPDTPSPPVPVAQDKIPPADRTPAPEPPKESAASLRLIQEAEDALTQGNVQLAYRKLKEAADAGSNTARLMLGRLLISSEYEIKDIPQGIKYLRAAADAGYAEAQYVCGKIFLLGEGVPGEPPLARKYLTLAAAQKHEQAQTLLQFLNYLEACDETGGQDGNEYFFGPRSPNGLPCFAGSKGPYREAFLKWSERELRRHNMANNPMEGVSDTFRWLQDMEASTGFKYVFEMARVKEKELEAPLWVNPEFQRLVDADLEAENTRLKVFEVYYQREMERLRLERERIEREGHRDRHNHRHRH